MLLLNCAIRFHLRNIPLERDEGEYAYAGQLMLQGIPPYKLAYNMKLPGTYAAYALILAVFGRDSVGSSSRRAGGEFDDGVPGVPACAATGRLDGSGGSRGKLCFALSKPVSAGVIWSCNSLRSADGGRRVSVAAPSARQESSMAILWKWSVTWACIRNEAARLVICDLWCVVFAAHRAAAWGRMAAAHRKTRTVLDRRRTSIRAYMLLAVASWSIQDILVLDFRLRVSVRNQLGASDGARLLITVFPKIMGPGIWIWLIAVVGAIAVVWNQKMRPQAPFVLGFLLFSFLAVCPGFLFREHYFILMLPAVSVLAGIAVSAGIKILSQRSETRQWRYVPVLVFVLALGWCFYAQRGFFLEDNLTSTSRKIYGGNPFPEAIPVADYIRQHTAENASIVVLGSEPEIYFYAHRHSATGYIYTYCLMEEQKYALQMQQQMISEIEAARPESLVWVNVKASWLPQEHSEGLLLSWAQKYVRDHYEMTGVADIHMSQTDYRWGDDAKSYQPRSNSVVFVFKRKAS